MDVFAERAQVTWGGAIHDQGFVTSAEDMPGELVTMIEADRCDDD